MQLIKYNLVQEQAYLDYILEWADDEVNVEGCIANTKSIELN